MALQNITQFFSPSFLSDSLLQKSLGEELTLCENGNMVFHWADFYETCDVIKARMEKDPELREDFANREDGLKRLNLIPVWIRTQSKIYQVTMHDLYQRYIMNQMHLIGGVDPFGPIEISFISGTGPFKTMSIAECFNKSTYKDFVLVYLLKDVLPKRDFRIRLKSKVLMEYGEDFQSAQLVSLEQLTVNGILLSVDSETFLSKFSDQSELRLLINTSSLASGTGLNLIDLETHLSQFAFNLLYSARKEDALHCSFKDFNVQSSFDFLKNKKVFLFVSYETLAVSNAKSVKNIQNFVAHTKDLVRDHYSKELNGKSKTA